MGFVLEYMWGNRRCGHFSTYGEIGGVATFHPVVYMGRGKCARWRQMSLYKSILTKDSQESLKFLHMTFSKMLSFQGFLFPLQGYALCRAVFDKAEST